MPEKDNETPRECGTCRNRWKRKSKDGGSEDFCVVTNEKIYSAEDICEKWASFKRF